MTAKMSETSLKDLETLVDNKQLGESDLRRVDLELSHLEKLKARELCQAKFIKFVEKV